MTHRIASPILPPEPPRRTPDGWLGKPFEYADLEPTVRRFAARPAR